MRLNAKEFELEELSGRGSAHTRFILIRVGILGLLLLSPWIGLDPILRGALQRLLQPAVHITHSAVSTAQGSLQVINTQRQLVRELGDLELKYTSLLAQVAEIEALRQENQELRQIIQEATVSGQRFPSQVWPIVTSYYRPSMAAGSQENVMTGQMVMLAQNLVGLVGEVGPHQAEILLLTDPTIPIILAKTESGAEGIITGDSRHIVLTEIPRETIVNPGERVVTLGQAGIRPGVFIGNVQVNKTAPSAATQTFWIEQVVSIHQARLVGVE